MPVAAAAPLRDVAIVVPQGGHFHLAAAMTFCGE